MKTNSKISGSIPFEKTYEEIELYELNTSQKAIIDHIFGPIQVLAPVGTGKTLILAERVVKAIEKGIDPKKILCLTFTNRAAEEMRARIRKYFPEFTKDLTIKTFHALCAYMLRIETRNIGLPQDFVIYDEIDSLESIQDHFGMRSEKDARNILQRIFDCKTNAQGERLSLDCPLEKLFEPLRDYFIPIPGICRYQETLRDRHALDFADLIFFTRVMLNRIERIRERWERKFDFVQVDEIQDAHMSEYDVVQFLARSHKNIAVIGDMDQTIYEWRGSDPFAIINRFENEFKPKKYTLYHNFRATKVLMKACSSFAESFYKRHTKVIPSGKCKYGEPIYIHCSQDEESEGDWIARQIRKLSHNNPNFPFNRTAILCRTNNRAQVVSKRLERQNIPCYTVEQYEFFRRQEIKDALAYLKALLHPVDSGSLQRMLRRPPRGIGEAAIKEIMEDGLDYGLRLGDMVALQTFHYGDPYGLILEKYHSGNLVVLDVETTGTSTEEDEVIEIAATRLFKGEPVDKYEALILSEKPVGESEKIHGISDDIINKYGKPAPEVFGEFFDFIRDSLLTGYNVSFDIKILLSHAKRAGIKTSEFPFEDIWPIAKRFISGIENYRLETVAKALNVPRQTAHRAAHDVAATVEVLRRLIPLTAQTAFRRQQIVNKHMSGFRPLALKIDEWKKTAKNSRPADTLRLVLNESGLKDYYQKRNELKRLEHLAQLERIFCEKDDLKKSPEGALTALVEFVSLAKNIDHFSRDENRVPIITIHQAKGLEFDNVFIAGVCQNEIPHYYSVIDGKEEEEKRLFYVALTRAKKQLFISMHSYNQYGRYRNISPYISFINRECLKEI